MTDEEKNLYITRPELKDALTAVVQVMAGQIDELKASILDILKRVQEEVAK